MINESTQSNINRKSSFINEVSFHDGKPLFSFIDINPTELCNRTCVFCPRHDSEVYPNQNLHMEIETAHKIRKELEELNWMGTINLCGNGEPLLHKDIVGLVKALGDKINVEITTNGDFLNKKIIQDLYDNHLDYMVVSMYDEPEQIEYFTKLFEDGKQCFYMHYSLQMDWNGDILSCCHDMYAKTITFGNVNEETLLEIWNSNMWSKSRKLLGEGKRIQPPCNNCDAGGTILGYNHYLEWNKEKQNV